MRQVRILGAAALSWAVALSCAGAPAGAVAPAGAAGGATGASSRGPSATPLLLKAADLGTGWRVSAPAPRKVPQIACGALHLRLRGGAAHPAAAATPTFRGSSSGPFASQTAYMYDKGSQARQVWRGVARHALLKCLSRSVVSGSSRRVSFAVVSARGLDAPHVRQVSAAAYRVTATATGSGQTVNAYVDTVLLRDGAAVSDLSFSSLLSPPKASLESRAARFIAARMRALASAS